MTLPGFVYKLESCERCGFSVRVTNERGEPVAHLAQLFADHVAECPIAPTREEKKRERRAAADADFLRAHRGERAAEKIEREVFS